jgi:hypothetical protein
LSQSAEPFYLSTMRKLRVRDPLGGKTAASIDYAKADKAWREKKEALARLGRTDRDEKEKTDGQAAG